MFNVKCSVYTAFIAHRSAAPDALEEPLLTTSMEFDQQFVEYIVKALVNKPEEVKSERKVDDQGVLITVHTSPEDTGYVIGKGGKTAVAIRTLLATLGAKGNMRISFRIDAPDNGKRRSGEMDGSAAPATAAPEMDDTAVDSLTF